MTAPRPRLPVPGSCPARCPHDLAEHGADHGCSLCNCNHGRPLTAAPWQPGDPVSWIGSEARFDRTLTVDVVRPGWYGGRPGRGGGWVYDLRDDAGDVVIFSACESELMPSPDTPASPARPARQAADGTGPGLASDPSAASLAWRPPPMSLIGELRGYTYPVCPECEAWAMYYHPQLSSDICGVCGWIADPEERAAQQDPGQG
jgi:hypothetical protein